MSKDTIHLFNNLSVKGIVANGSVGAAGEVLHSNGTIAYWAVDDNSGGTVTSVATANGLSGGPITATGTIGVVSGSTLTVNASGIHVNTANLSVATSQLTGDVALGANTSGNYVATITAGNGISGSSSSEGGTPTIAVVAGNGTVISNTLGVYVNAAALSIATSQLTGDVALGANTSGNYVATITNANGISGSSASEGGTPTIGVVTGSTLTVNTTGIHVNSALSITDLALTGNLTVSGTRTYINTTTLEVGDNIVTLNADLGANPPTENAGIEIMRGTSANVQFIWDESNDRWTTNSQPLAISSLVAAGAASGITTLAAGNTTITGFANVSSTLQVGTNTATFGTAVNIVANGNVGVGTSAPTARMHVVDQDNAGWRYEQYNNGDGTNFRNFRARGTIASPTAIQSGDRLASFLGAGYNGTAFNSPNGGISVWAAETFSNTTTGGTYVTIGTAATGTNPGGGGVERMRIDSSGNVGIGNTVPSSKLVVAGTVELGNTTITGFASATTEMRAPIFYDSANTSFYVDPASTSNLLGLTVTNRITGSVTGTTFTNDATNKADITTRTDSGFYEHDTVTTAEGWPLNNNSWMHMLATTHSNDSNYYSMQIAADFYNNSPFYRSTNGSGATAWSRFALYDNAYSSNLRATIFYDNDNTAYYFDGSSTGTSIFTAGGMQLYGQDGFRFNSASAITTMRFGSAFTGESTAELAYNRATGTTTISQGNSGSALTQTIGITTTGLTLAGSTHYIRTDKLLLQHDGTDGYIRSVNAGSHLYLGGSNQNTVQIATGNYLFSQGSVRAPIFYDSDDTSRLFNGTGGINFLTGTGNRVTVYSDDSGFYVNNAEGNGGLLRLGAAYGLTGVYVNPSLYLQSENTIFFRTQNVQRASIDSSGILSVSGDVRAPIFYDSANTSFYLDAASTSNIGSTYVNGYFQIQYGSQYSGMGIRNNYGSASLESTSFIDFINENGYQKASVFGTMATNGAGYLQFLATATGVSRSADVRTAVGYAYSNQWQFLTSAGITSNIFYDRDNTGYYTDPNGNSVLSTLYMYGNLTMDTGGLIVGRTSASTDVNVANDTGSFSARGNTSTIASMSFHRTGAYAINMGVGTDNVFRIGGWSAANNCLQVTGAGNIYALTDSRAPVFYKTDDTNVRLDGNNLVLRGGSPTVFLRDTDHNSAMLHCNSNLFYVLRGGNDTESWSTVGSGNWPLVISLSNNDATFGGNVTATYSMYAESYYDRNDSAYYVDLAGNNRMRNLNLGGGSGFDASLHMVGAQGGYDRLTQMGPNTANKPGLNILASRSAGNADQWWAWGPTAANVWCINSGTGLGTGGIQIDTSGNFTAAANVTAYSDLRLKKNIVQITDAIAKVKAIRGVTFERIDNGSRGTGVIAQEIEKVLPEVVLENQDGIKSVAYGNMVGLLIEAIKEQQAHINRLEQKINSLGV